MNGNGSIFLVRPGDTLVELRESQYDSEAILQTYLADHPSLLPGDQISPDAPRRWLLVTQEMAVPDAADGADRWSLDHLFLDQDAVPTLIETKRSSDTRIRREIVGQMLDYAANGVVYWPIDKLRSAFQRTCEKQGTTTEDALATFLGDDADQDEFWQRVEENLKTGRIRMVFVSDRIPQDLQRIVEFLNAQMDPAEVIAVEIKQFVGEGMTTLVPRVLGAMASNQPKKAASTVKWNEDRFAAQLSANGLGPLVLVFREYVSWTREKGLRETWGTGAGGSFAAYLPLGGRKATCAKIETGGAVIVIFVNVQNVPGFEKEERRQELVRKFNRIPGVQLAEDHTTGYASFPADLLLPEDSRQLFLGTVDWFFTEVRAAIANAGQTP